MKKLGIGWIVVLAFALAIGVGILPLLFAQNRAPATLQYEPSTNTMHGFVSGTGTDIVLSGGALGTVTSVSGTAPIVVATGTTTPAISCVVATGSVDGCLAAADFTTFNAKQPQLFSAIQDCGTMAACGHTALTTGKVVVGSVALSTGSPSTATITGISPAFTDATTYQCAVTNVTDPTKNLLGVTYVSGTSFTITGPNTNTNTISYICAGH